MCDWKEHPISCPYLRVREADGDTLLDRWMHLGLAGLRAALLGDEVGYLTICELSLDNAKECTRRKLSADPARVQLLKAALELESRGKKLPSWYAVRNIRKDEV